MAGSRSMCYQGKTHKHKQTWGIILGLGGWQIYVSVFFFVRGHSLWGRKTHINNITPQNPGTIPCFVYVFFSFGGFSRSHMYYPRNPRNINVLSPVPDREDR